MAAGAHHCRLLLLLQAPRGHHQRLLLRVQLLLLQRH